MKEDMLLNILNSLIDLVQKKATFKEFFLKENRVASASLEDGEQSIKITTYTADSYIESYYNDLDEAAIYIYMLVKEQ